MSDETVSEAECILCRDLDPGANAWQCGRTCAVSFDQRR
jgi:hypothetical protein